MYFIDVQGTLISDKDKSPIKGAINFIDMLNEKKIPYVIITNNTKTSSEDFLSFLNDIGFNINHNHYIDPLMVLKKKTDIKKVAAYGSRKFLENLKKLGYELDFYNPEAVLIAIKEDFSNEEYADMIKFTLNGAKLIGMHETSIYAKNNKSYPGVGAILKMISFATQKDYEVIGKPSVTFYNEALNLLKKQTNNAKFEDITIISDDVVGDLVGAKKLKMKTVFVTSGKFQDANKIVPSLKIKPDLIYDSIKNLL